LGYKREDRPAAFAEHSFCRSDLFGTFRDWDTSCAYTGEYPIPTQAGARYDTAQFTLRDSAKLAGKDREGVGGKDCDALHYDKILGLIRATTTTTGLKVRAYLDTREYPLKVKPSAQRLRELRITRHTTLPKWNYTIVPSNCK
jgi:hypothetical protein